MQQPPTTECPDCCGTGTQYQDRPDYWGEHTTVEVQCEGCGGEGTVSVEADDEAEGAAA